MHKKAIELLERLRRLKAQPPLTVDNVVALAEEFQRLGRDQFIEEVKKALAPRTKGPRTPRDPLAASIEDMQAKTRLDRKTFLGHVVDKIAAENAKMARLARTRHSLPQLIAFYEPKLGRARLLSNVASVANEHSHIH